MSREKVSRRQKDISRLLREKKNRRAQNAKKTWKKKPS
jgi:hypothetical protein